MADFTYDNGSEGAIVTQFTDDCVSISGPTFTYDLTLAELKQVLEAYKRYKIAKKTRRRSSGNGWPLRKQTIKLWVTKNNHEFIRDETGLPLEQIGEIYLNCRHRGLICSLKVDRKTGQVYARQGRPGTDDGVYWSLV